MVTSEKAYITYVHHYTYINACIGFLQSGSVRLHTYGGAANCTLRTAYTSVAPIIQSAISYHLIINNSTVSDISTSKSDPFSICEFFQGIIFVWQILIPDIKSIIDIILYQPKPISYQNIGYIPHQCNTSIRMQIMDSSAAVSRMDMVLLPLSLAPSLCMYI